MVDTGVKTSSIHDRGDAKRCNLKEGAPVKEKDLYEDLIRFYEFQSGKLPNRQEFKEALRVTFTQEDLRMFFLLPFFGMTSIEKLEQKAAKIGIPKEELHQIVKRLVPQGIIDSYVSPSGRLCGRAPSMSGAPSKPCLSTGCNCCSSRT